jgi:hypothetical protein
MSVDVDRALGRAGDVLDGVLEAPPTPRHDHPEGLVPLRTVREDVDAHALAHGAQAGAAVDLVDVDAHREGPGSDRASPERPGQRRAAAEHPDGLVGDLDAGAAVEQPDRVQGGVVEVGHGERDHVGRSRHRPVLPSLGPAPGAPPAADAVGDDEGSPGPAHRVGVEPPVGEGEQDRRRDLALGNRTVRDGLREGNVSHLPNSMSPPPFPTSRVKHHPAVCR